MRTFKNIKDPKAFEMVADETRRKIIYLLRAKEQTVSQLADELDKTPQAIYHQIRKLVETGLVEVAREERVDHFIETYYRASAEVFEFSHGESTGEELERQVQEAIDALSMVGLKVSASPDDVKRIADIERRHSALGLTPELEDDISNLPDAGFHTRQFAAKIAQLVMMSDKQFDQMMSDERELRDLLKSKLQKPTPQAQK